MNQLGELGFLQKAWNARRGLSVSVSVSVSVSAEPQPQVQVNRVESALVQSLPLLGRVAAGRPIEAIQSPEMIEVPASLLRKSGEHFILKVQGDSMIGDGILDGDFVVIRKQSTAENGETVVALIENEATIKRYQKHRSQIELHAANPAYPAIQVKPGARFKIEGILAGLIRKLP